MGGGGAPPGQLAAYPTKVTDWIDSAIGTPSDLTFTLVEALEYAKGLNPWTSKTPYDPSTVLATIETDVETFTDEAQALDPDTDIESYVDQAATKYDATVNSTAQITALVDAHDNATLSAFRRRVSAQNVGMHMQGAFMTTQFGVGGLMVAAERGYEIAKYREVIETQNMNVRVQGILEIARMMLQERLASVQSKQAAFGARMDYLKAVMLATDDYTDKLIEYALRERTYDMTLLSDGSATVMSVLGSQLVPRAMTKGERAVARIGTAINTGLQFGAATSPIAGLLAGLGSLGISAIGERADG